MSGEIQADLGVTSGDFYALVRLGDQIYDGVGLSTYDADFYETYPITMTQQGLTGFWTADWPAALDQSAIFSVIVKEQAGGFPAESDETRAEGVVDRRTFTAAEETGAVEVDHNYGGTDALVVTAPSGAGVDGVDIHVYLKSDYDAGNRSNDYVVARTLTTVGGRWARPVMLDAGVYTLIFHKQGQFGPDRLDLTVE
jgi:hypothetical protein